MKNEVKTLPKGARYEYTDVFGQKIYHTEKNRYEVSQRKVFGQTVTKIYEEPLRNL